MMRKLALALVVASLISCRTRAPQPSPLPQPLPEFPYQDYRPQPGAFIYKINGGRSRADILVHRGGKLAQFGHDHVMTAEHIHGYVLLNAHDFKRSQADLRLNLNTLIVDDPMARKRFALDKRPSARDIRKTQENMQLKVLQSDYWPQVHLKIEIAGGTPGAPEARLFIYLHGVQRSFPITFKTEGMGQAQFLVKGSFSLRQSDFGIQPFSILGGGLKVLDQVDVHYTLVADKVDSPE